MQRGVAALEHVLLFYTTGTIRVILEDPTGCGMFDFQENSPEYSSALSCIQRLTT